MYPTSKNETIADGVVHAFSISVGLICAVWMWTYPPMWQNTGMAWAVGIYLVIMVCAFIVSGVYHMTPISEARVILRRADHGSIFLRIASTYTPLVLLINTPFSYVILAGVWGVALFGFFSKLIFWQGEGGSSMKLYFALSCAMFLIFWPMWQNLNHNAVLLLLLGGAIYGVGAGIYSRKTMPFRYPVWHVFATTASVVFFLAIALIIS